MKQQIAVFSLADTWPTPEPYDGEEVILYYTLIHAPITF